MLVTLLNVSHWQEALVHCTRTMGAERPEVLVYEYFDSLFILMMYFGNIDQDHQTDPIILALTILYYGHTH